MEGVPRKYRHLKMEANISISTTKKKTPLFLCESVKRSHYVYGEGLEILMLIKKDKDIFPMYRKRIFFWIRSGSNIENINLE